jgi:hypothetical protein
MAFFGEVDRVTRRRDSWFSNTIVLPGLSIYEALKIDDPKKLDWKDYAFDLSGRRLEGAVFDGANLAKVNLTDAHLERASLNWVRLQGATLVSAKLQGAALFNLELQGAKFDRAQLQGAALDFAELQGASLSWAQLRGASLVDSMLEGTRFDTLRFGTGAMGTQLQGANLQHAQLQGASLQFSDLTAADLGGASLWRANFNSATLRSLSARDLHWTAVEESIIGINPWSEREYFDLKSKMERDIPAGDLRTIALKRIEILDCKIKSDRLAPCSRKVAQLPIQKHIDEAAVDKQTYAEALSTSLIELVCDGDHNAIYILRGLIRNSRIKGTGSESAKLVDRIQSKDCPVSTLLTQNDKTALRHEAEAATPTLEPGAKK